MSNPHQPIGTRDLIRVAGDFRLGLFEVRLHSCDIMTCHRKAGRKEGRLKWGEGNHGKIQSNTIIDSCSKAADGYIATCLLLFFETAPKLESFRFDLCPLQTTEFQPWTSWQVAGFNPFCQKKPCHSLLWTNLRSSVPVWAIHLCKEKSQQKTAEPRTVAKISSTLRRRASTSRRREETMSRTLELRPQKKKSGKSSPEIFQNDLGDLLKLESRSLFDFFQMIVQVFTSKFREPRHFGYALKLGKSLWPKFSSLSILLGIRVARGKTGSTKNSRSQKAFHPQIHQKCLALPQWS